MAQPETAQRMLERERAWLIGLALLCCYGYFFYLGGNWNVESRNAQLFALAERGSLVIDDYPFLPEGGGDAARFFGHYYSDKLVGPSLAAAPVYWAARRAIGLLVADDRLAVYVALRVANLVVNALPSALIGALIYLFLAELGLAAQLRVWVALVYGLGTLALPYATAFFGHQFAAACVTGSFMLLWRQRAEWSARRALAAGGLAGMAAISDVMGFMVALFLGFYAIWPAFGQGEARRVRASTIAGRVVVFAGIASLPIAVQLGANWWSFGSPLIMPHVYHAQESFRARHAAGLLGLHLPKLYPLYQLTLGPWRGLYYGSPVLLLALPGLAFLGRRWRAETVLIAAAWVSVLLLHSGYENWTAGSSYGPRYQIPVIPLLMVAAALAAQRWPFLFKSLALISIAFTVAVTAQSPFPAEEIRNPLAVALGKFSAEELAHGNLGRLIGLPGLLSLLPLAAVEAAFLYALSGIGVRER